MTNLKFLQIGLGSMGKRRIRTLLFHKIPRERIFGFDPNPARANLAGKKYKINTFTNFQKAIKETRPDVFIISTPPDKHHPYFLYAGKHKKHFFVEVGTSLQGYSKLLKLLDKKIVAAPSCTFRYFPAVKKIKWLLARNAIGRPLTFIYHSGLYLPDWHPWEDYRKVYFAKKPSGACREIFVYALIWLTKILDSKVSKVSGLARKISDLQIPADDIYAGIVEMKNRVMGHLLIDVVTPTPFHTLRIIGTAGVLECDLLQNEIKVFQRRAKNWKKIRVHSDKENMYFEETRAFLDAINKKRKYPYSFQEDREILKTLLALEKSSKSGKTVKV